MGTLQLAPLECSTMAQGLLTRSQRQSQAMGRCWCRGSAHTKGGSFALPRGTLCYLEGLHPSPCVCTHLSVIVSGGRTPGRRNGLRKNRVWEQQGFWQGKGCWVCSTQHMDHHHLLLSRGPAHLLSSNKEQLLLMALFSSI